jgi:putative redox protein
MQMKVSFPGNKKVHAHVQGFTIETDQPQQGGGDNSAPSPFVLFLASLATCAGFYVKSFCDGRKISAEGIEITQSLDFNQETRRIDTVIINISLPSDFPEKYKDAVVLSANQCAVKQYLANPFEVLTTAEIRTS